MRKLTLVFVLCLPLLFGACLGYGQWHADQKSSAPGDLLMQKLTAAKSAEPQLAAHIPDIPVRRKFRMCCAFGTDLSVRLGRIPIPFLRVGKILNLEDLGPHRYDGATAAIDDERENAFPGGEANGMMYTCRGGFLDTAHIREQVDWVAYFVSQLDRHLETGVEVELSPEGAERRLILRPFPSYLIEEYGRDEVVLAVAQWLAYQGSVWHEIAQWYGWSLLNLYSERVSGFSPEDPISNVIGVKLLSGTKIDQVLESEKVYNHHVDQLMQVALQKLGPVSSQVGEQAISEVDQVWWDSNARLPDRHLVRRRYMDADTELEAWLMPESLASPELKQNLARECGPKPKPAVFKIPESLGGVQFSDFASLEITPIGKPAQQTIFEEVGRTVTPEDFERIMEDVRDQNERAFGPRAARPD